MTHSLPKHSKGAALLIALIMLVVVTLLGVSSMKSSLFQEKMTLNSKADAVTFQTAESAIQAVLEEARNPKPGAGPGIAAQAISSDNVAGCLTAEDQMTSGKCEGNQRFNGRDAAADLQAQASTKFTGNAAVFGIDVDIATYYLFDTDGKGRFTANEIPYANHNLQQWKRLGQKGENILGKLDI